MSEGGEKFAMSEGGEKFAMSEAGGARVTHDQVHHVLRTRCGIGALREVNLRGVLLQHHVAGRLAVREGHLEAERHAVEPGSGRHVSHGDGRRRAPELLRRCHAEGPAHE